jgi:hypothetical protein
MPTKYIPHPEEVAAGVPHYTADEAAIIAHFFTSADPHQRIYAVTDAMPTQLWALLEGGYSRSALGMRERFLAIFKEMYDDPNQYAAEMSALATCCSSVSYESLAIFKQIMDRATKFM